MDLALKIARIEDFCDKSSGLADFENAVDHGSAVISTRIPDCVCLLFGSWVPNEISIIDLSSALVTFGPS